MCSRMMPLFKTRLLAFDRLRIDHWAAVLMFVGSLLFEVNSIFQVIPKFANSVELARQHIWSFSLCALLFSLIFLVSHQGASLFLVSGYLQFLEQVHTWIAWQPRSIGYWATTFGTLGGLFFVLPSIIGFWSDHLLVVWWGTNLGFLIGSLCFLVNGYCLILERVNP